METVYEIVKIKQVIKESDFQDINSIRSPSDAIELAKKIIGDDDREVLLVMCLNTKNQVVAVHRCHVGSLNASLIHPREVFKAAILNNACSIILSHNHPSGSAIESREDIAVTKRLKEAGEIMEIELLDHVIVSPLESRSLRERGHLD